MIGADEELPNDFFIRNTDETDERQLAVADGAGFVLIGFDASGGVIDSPVATDELALLFAGSADTGEFYDDTKRYIDRAALTDEQRTKIFESNVQRVYPRLQIPGAES